jgi:uncharacterized protein (TIGR02679 family)
VVALWDRLADHPLTARGDVRAWLVALREQGVLARLAGSDGPGEAASLAEAALEVIRRLPASGAPLAVLASEACHNPHALDSGRPVATLVLRWAAAFTGRDGVPVLARDRRQLWSDVGVTCDPLSASVLVLGLRARGRGLLATTLAAHADAGEPLRLTLRQLLGHPLASLHGRVHVCENPAVVAAAANRLGAACCALVCVEGMPDTAGDRLLGMLAAGAPLAFHCDFDWGGVRIGNVLVTRSAPPPGVTGARTTSPRWPRVALAPHSPLPPSKPYGTPSSALRCAPLVDGSTRRPSSTVSWTTWQRADPLGSLWHSLSLRHSPL